MIVAFSMLIFYTCFQIGVVATRLLADQQPEGGKSLKIKLNGNKNLTS